MGNQRVLQAATAALALAGALCAAATAVAAPRFSSSARERIAVIDLSTSLGPPGDSLQRLAAAIAAAGFDPVIGDGVDDALAGRDMERDAVAMSVAMTTAAQAFGQLACGDAIPAARQAIGLAAQRQAAGRAVPELPRAWAYVLLCADREGKLDAAQAAAGQLRALGGSPDVPAAVWSKYPAVDALANREHVEVDIDADVAGAEIWVDFQRAGTSPVHLVLPAGEHVLAAASGTQRGWAAGTPVRTQKQVHIPMTDTAGPWADLARRVAGWHGAPPPPAELAWVLGRVHARIALIRRGNAITAWGQIGHSELPHPIGGDDATAPIADAGRVLGAVADRVQAWNAHAPDPDQPLLTEERAPRGEAEDRNAPTKWWVYAAIGAALAASAAVIVVHEAGSDHQRVELHYP